MNHSKSRTKKECKPASQVKDFRNWAIRLIKIQIQKTCKISLFVKFSTKSRDNFVRRKLKVNSILTSLDFCYQISVFSLAFYFLHGPTAQNKHGSHYAGPVESDK
jgi:hypothetical protein